MRKLSLAFLVILCAVFSAYGQTKKQDIVKLLDMMDTKSQATQMIDLMLPSMQAMVPEAPAEFWIKFKAGVKTESFIEMLVSIYDKYLSHDDIKNLIKFYESPIGKKLVKITPLLTQDSYQAGEKWGEKLAQDIIEELKKQGYF